MLDQSFGASFRLDISLANDAAVFIALLAHGGQTRMKSPRKPSGLQFGCERAHWLRRGLPKFTQTELGKNRSALIPITEV
jgi:hypothetical protein